MHVNQFLHVLYEAGEPFVGEKRVVHELVLENVDQDREQRL